MDTLYPLKTRAEIFAQVRKLMRDDPKTGMIPLYELYPIEDGSLGHGIAQGPWIVEAYAALGIPLQPDPGIARGEAAWAGWETFTDRQLFETNIAFIKNEIGWTPYHWGPLYMELAPSVPLLVKMHEHGLFTCNGQAQQQEVTEMYDGWTEERQLSYISFYSRDSDALRRFFLEIESYGFRYLFRLRDNEYFCNTMTDSFVLTDAKAAPTRSELADTPWTPFSVLTLDRSSRELPTDLLSKMFPHSNGWVFGIVVSRSTSVEPYIVRALENVGVPRVL